VQLASDFRFDTEEKGLLSEGYTAVTPLLQALHR
jgi:hypothetical protein